jgi:ribosomal protein S12 methylthiotransferase accessory factor
MGARVETAQSAELLRTAAAILTGEAAAEGAAFDLLVRLEYLEDQAIGGPHRVALLRAAVQFRRIFSLPSEDAPGLFALGAEVDAGCLGVVGAPVGGVSGIGLSFRQAFEACVGEGVEYISQFATPDDRLVSLTAADALADAASSLRALWVRLEPYRRVADGVRTDWAVAADLADGRPVLLPADLCLRRPAAVRVIEPPWPLSIGCGAGTDALGATLHGVLELVERDAVALWLRGGVRPRVVPPGVGAGLLERMRGEAAGGAAAGRRTWLLDVTSDVGVPVVVAAACNADGFGLCRGSACRPTLAAAAAAALMELAQMEIGYRLSVAKRAVRGEAALNDGDREHIDRFMQIDVAATEALHPLAPPRPSCDLLPVDRISVLAAVRAKLEAVGVEVYAMNLTRQSLGIAVTRMLAPALETGLASPPGPRLVVTTK